jgi:AraC-like DNA-binding protein
MSMTLALRHRLGGYREFEPPAAVAAFCENVWWYKTPPGESGAVHRVLPDLAVNVQFAYLRADDGSIEDPRVILGGPLRTPEVAGFEPRREIVALKMKLEWCERIIDLPSVEHRQWGLELGDVQPRLAAELVGRLEEAGSMENATTVLVDGIVRHGEPRKADGAGIVARALDLVRRTNGRCAVERIAECLRVSPRYLRRGVDREIGMSLKRYARVVRLLNAVTTADACPAGQTIAWASVAADAGFYDQSHLIRECHDLCGLTPREIMSERRSEIEIMEDQSAS